MDAQACMHPIEVMQTLTKTIEEFAEAALAAVVLGGVVLMIAARVIRDVIEEWRRK